MVFKNCVFTSLKEMCRQNEKRPEAELLAVHICNGAEEGS